MVINIIDVAGVAVLKAKNNAPVGAYRHGVGPKQFTLKRVQPVAREIRIGDDFRRFKTCQNAAQFLCVFRKYAAGIVIFIKPFQSFVTDRADHALA